MILQKNTTSKKMLNIGLKLWSTNKNYIRPAIDLFDGGYYKYIELFAIPDSFNEYIPIWEKLNIPFIIHAPHHTQGMNLADKKSKNNNIKLANEAFKFADKLHADKIIFHPGVNGIIEETISQIQNLNDSRIIIENKPYYGNGENLICNGYSPGDIQKIINQADIKFCLDIGHSINAANAQKINWQKYIKKFLKLKPIMFHLSDGDIDGILDKHLNLGDGTFKIKEILNLLPKNATITLETNKNSNDNLNDFIEDVNCIRST